jgi:2-polyprenyl-6-methoxyphenol hydroxylase-like FAD-dependent oxidoreductase
MPAVNNVLVVGAGLAGTGVAIHLAAKGVAVDLIEIKPEVAALGSGITLQGNALRELKSLGVWDQVEAAGYAFDTTGIRAPDPNGTVVAEVSDAKTGGPDLPAVMGMPRPELARILVDRATEVGVKVRLGTTFTDLSQDADGVDVTFADGAGALATEGRHGRYDLVIGADGLRSWTRRALGIDLETTSVGMGIWRAFGPRPASVTRTDLYYGGPSYIAGYCPTGENSLYAYIVEDAQDRSALSPEEQLATMKQLSQAYHGPWDEIRETLTDPSRVNYTWFETHVLDAPWNRGRVVLIGDAAHTCPPTIAQGGAMALEDAVVLAELLTERDALDQDLWDAFMARRFERAKTVVDASNQLAQWQLEHVQGDIPSLMRSIAMLTSQPA